MLAAALPSAAPPARARPRADAADAAPLDCAGIMESAEPLALRAVPKRRRSDCTAPSNGSDDAAADDVASAPQSRRRRRSPPPPREVHRRANGVPSLRNHTWARKKELMLDWLRSQNGAPVIDGSGDYAAIKEAFDERVALLRPVRTRNDGVPILESHTQARKKQLMLDWLRSQRKDDGAPVIDAGFDGDYAAVAALFDEHARPVRHHRDGVPILDGHPKARKQQLMLDWLRSLRSEDGAPVIGADWSGDYAAVKAAFDEHRQRSRADGVPILQGHGRDMRREMMVTWLREQRTEDGEPLIPDGDVTFASTPDGDYEVVKDLFDRTVRAETGFDTYAEYRRNHEIAQRVLDRLNPPRKNQARNARKMLRYDDDVWTEAEKEADIGRLGDQQCTFCEALLWPAETVAVPRAKDVEGGTGCCGKTCCSKGTVLMEPVERSPAVDALFDNEPLRKTLVKHSRKYARFGLLTSGRRLAISNGWKMMWKGPPTSSQPSSHGIVP